jgi:hypothetical protein
MVVPLIGDVDRFSGRSGECIAIKVCKTERRSVGQSA